jgi:uncharacterized protein YjiS (DUF1127 family)
MLQSTLKLASGLQTSVVNSVSRVCNYARNELPRSAATRANRKVYAELNQMPDYLLSDIGLDRMQLRAYALGCPIGRGAGLSTNKADASERPSNDVSCLLEDADDRVVIDVGVQFFTIATKSRSGQTKSAAQL